MVDQVNQYVSLFTVQKTPAYKKKMAYWPSADMVRPIKVKSYMETWW